MGLCLVGAAFNCSFRNCGKGELMPYVFRLWEQSWGLAFSFGWDSNITANFQVPLCQATVRGGRGGGGMVAG